MSPTPAGRSSILALAGVTGFATVLLAALGSHAVPLADAHAGRLWNTANALLGFHAVALLGIAALTGRQGGRLLPVAAGLMFCGSVLFSGSLFLRAVAIDVLPSAVPPFGGVLLLGGWSLLTAAGLLRSRLTGADP